jgi:hypothetical protein
MPSFSSTTAPGALAPKRSVLDRASLMTIADEIAAAG